MAMIPEMGGRRAVRVNDELPTRPGLGLAARCLRRGIAQTLYCGVALVLGDLDEARAGVDGFWSAMVVRARVSIGFGQPMTLAALVEAVTVERTSVTGGGVAIVRDASDMAPGYFSEGEMALLAPRSSAKSPAP